MKLIDKDALVAKLVGGLNKYKKEYNKMARYEVWETAKELEHKINELEKTLNLINAFEVKDPYEQIVQYDSIKAGIQAHAEIYSFNIESKLFNQLTEEQQKLWRKEIEQACISGGEAGVELARDARYKENLEVKEVDLEKEISKYLYSHLGRPRMELELDWTQCDISFKANKLIAFAKHFFELGLKTQKGV